MAMRNKPVRILSLLYLFLAAVYLLTGSARLGNSDAGSMFAVTRSMYTHRWIDADPCVAETNGNQCVPGVDGHNYSGYGVLSSAIVYPAFAVGWRAGALLHKDRSLLASAAVSLFNCLLTPLVSVVFCLWIVRMGYSWAVAVAAALTLGLATPLWFHGVKGFHSEPHFTLAFLTCCFLLSQPRMRGSGWLAGLCFGLALGSRVYGLILLPVLIWYALRVARREGITERVPGSLIAFLAMVGVGLIGIGIINTVRFGSPLKSGYHLIFPTVSALLATPLLKGLWGVLLDGEVGLLWYTPLLLALPFAWKRFRAAHAEEAWLCLAVCVLSILFFAKYAAWHGGWSYGPRLLVPILPFVVMPLAALYEQVSVPAAQRQRLALGALVAVSLCVQMLGLTSSTARYYNLTKYDEETGRRPWWHDVALLQTVDALPKLLAYRAPAKPNATFYSRQEHKQIEAQEHDYSSPEAYLRGQPNSINLLTFDIWLFKASAMGLPRALVALAAIFLLTVSIVSGRLLWQASGPAEIGGVWNRAYSEEPVSSV